MGLFKGDKWRCENCDKTYSSNPSKCRNCGHTVLQQHSSSSDRRTTTERQIQQGSTETVVWYCSKCKQKHDEPRDSCKVCGTTEFDKVESGRADGSTTGYQEPEEGTKTISNISEIPTTETTSQKSDGQLNWLYIISVLVVLTLVFISML